MKKLFASLALAAAVAPVWAATQTVTLAVPGMTCAACPITVKKALSKVEGVSRHCCKVSDEAAFCLIQRPYVSKTLLTRRISPRGSP